MDRSDWLLGALMGAIHFTFHLFLRLVPPLIPVFVLELTVPLWKLGLLVSLYFAGSSVGLLPMGVLSDRYDRRYLLSGALALVAAAYLLFSAAPVLGAGLPDLILAGQSFGGPFVVMGLAMVVAGLGTSAHIPVGVPLLTRNVSPDHKGTVLGIWGGASKLGDAAGPAIVGVLILAFAWEEILRAFGLLGFALAAGLFVVLSRGPFETRPSAAGSGGRDGPAAAPSPWRGDRRRYLYPIAALMGYFAMYNVVVQGVVAFTPTFVVEAYGYTLTAAGVRFGPESFADFALASLLIAAAVSRFVGGTLTDRYDGRAVLAGTLAVAALSLFAFSALSFGPIAMLAVLAVFGMGLWGNSPARDVLISDLTPADREGRTFSYLWTASRVFAAVTPVLVGYLADAAGIRTGFALLAVATLLAAGFVALLFSDRVYLTGPAPDVALGDD